MTHEYIQRVETELRRALNQGDADGALRLGAILDEYDTERRVRLTSPALVSAALWYAENGIAVFPLQPRGKLPATQHGFKDATTDTEQVREWWRHQPDRNIGAPTGHTFDVIDIDGHEGVKTWARFTRPADQWEDTHCYQCGCPLDNNSQCPCDRCPRQDTRWQPDHTDGELPPVIGKVSTPRPGGTHLYVPPTGRGNKANVYPGHDYRGIGGYVVVPPSIGANNIPYRWIRPLNTQEAE